MPITDSSIMSFGIHKGKAMIDVPDQYLLFLYDNNKCNADLRKYIEENIDSINKNVFNKEDKREKYYH